MNIALFGTSADPPTRGHGKVLAWLAEHYDEVAIWAADNPFKQHQASLDQRSAMLKILVAELGQDNLKIYPELNYRRSVMSVAEAQKQWPQATFTLVIGSDLVAQLPSWYQAQALLAQVQLLIVPRPGNPLGEAALAPLQALGARLSIAAMEGLDISSTAFRNSCIDHMLSPAVLDYVHQQDLYACEARQLIEHLSPAAPEQSPIAPPSLSTRH
jgi:nicotinate-nucleotide adenylyltransferase